MYVTPAEVRAVATAMPVGAKSASTPAMIPDDTLVDLIERASRFFDLCCGVEPGYFEAALYPVWESGHVYVVGDIVTPTTPNAHQYRVTTAGTSGATEPTFPTGSGATVTNGTVTFTENGADVVATTRTVYGDGSNYLRLPPYVPGTLSSSVTVPTGYTSPEFVAQGNFLVRASSGVLPLGFTSTFVDPWTPGLAITVTAKWGYESTPEDVKLAVIELVINLYRETDPAFLKLVNLEGQLLRENLPPRVSEIAKRYRYKGVAFV